MLTIEQFLKEVHNLTIPQIDYAGGHIVSMHMNQSDAMLKTRAKSERVDASTFYQELSEDEILDMIFTAVEEYAPDLVDWLNDPTDGGNYEASFVFDKAIGKVYSCAKWHEWNKGACPCSEICVAFIKDERKYDTSFKIISVYPRATEEEKEIFKSL